MLVGVVLPFARDDGEAVGLREATLAAWCLAAAFACFGAGGISPPLQIAAGNILLWSGATFNYLAYRRFNGRRSGTRAVFAVLACVSLLFLALLLSGATYAPRAVYSSVVIATVMTLCVRELVRDQGLRRERSRWIGISLSGLVAACMLLRVGLLLASPPDDQNLLAPSLERTIAFFPAVLYTLGGGLGLLVLYRERSERRSRRLAMSDPMTGCANRRALEEEVRTQLASAKRTKEPISIIVADVDRFKRVNDIHGHVVGDAVIRHVADVLRRGVRRGDVVARYGGEEFCILLPRTEPRSAADLAERLRIAVEAAPVPARSLAITASFGVAGHDPFGEESWEDLFKRADVALYGAKKGGRNCVCLARPPDGLGDAHRIVTALGARRPPTLVDSALTNTGECS